MLNASNLKISYIRLMQISGRQSLLNLIAAHWGVFGLASKNFSLLRSLMTTYHDHEFRTKMFLCKPQLIFYVLIHFAHLNVSLKFKKMSTLKILMLSSNK